jgi:hypothetical protein
MATDDKKKQEVVLEEDDEFEEFEDGTYNHNSETLDY